MENLEHILSLSFEFIGILFDIFGVIMICFGIILATWHFLQSKDKQYHSYKVEIAKALLLGLEILVAADIIKTIALEPNFASLGVLAALVAIRSFLSWALIIEIEGRLPWQRSSERAEA